MWSMRLKTDEERRLEPPEPEERPKCSVCQGEVSDIYGQNDMGENICIGCLEEEWSHLHDDEKFEMLGYEVIR